MADEEDKYPEFIPFKSIGGFKFDTPVEKYADILKKDFIFQAYSTVTSTHYVSRDENIMITLEKGMICSVFCYYELYYNGINLIGLNLNDFKKIFQCNYVGEVDEIYMTDEDYPTYVYEFDDIGAQVWEALGKIVTIIGAGKESYSTEPCYD